MVPESKAALIKLCFAALSRVAHALLHKTASAPHNNARAFVYATSTNRPSVSLYAEYWRVTRNDTKYQLLRLHFMTSNTLSRIANTLPHLSIRI
ncbi:hypothetical protein K491DRAFT_695941 [Lophiostoma macrostomum CBS 122681]|uniref:Secreted protein n=1 Tax=Lophiostoma macrostomum CBS 122681 TaxID=1314788 RepID=A0A6A6SYE5_9PLEO|nr:hypothetical protein K491DRAFT_695941 [Lophiostoma macrostomum CBS 122681]